MSEDDAVRKPGAEPKVRLGSEPHLESAAHSAAGADHRPPLSCYIRTLNEERRIAEVVAAALRIAREVIVVDSGSTDATIERATAAGADVRHQDWLGNGRQKRVGEELCANDWLLDLDADEVVTPELAAEIAALFKSGAPEHSVYTIPLVTAPPVGQPWRGTDVARRAKLYNRRVCRMPDHAAWDQLELARGVKVGRLKGALLHYSFTGIEHLITKVNKNTSVRAREARLKPLWQLRLRILFGLPFYFARRYLINGLILRGAYGFAFALAVSVGRWLRDVKMYEIHKKREEGQREEDWSRS